MAATATVDCVKPFVVVAGGAVMPGVVGDAPGGNVVPVVGGIVAVVGVTPVGTAVEALGGAEGGAPEA